MLSSTRLGELRDAFRIHSRSTAPANLLPARNIVIALRAVGHNPTSADMARVFATLQPQAENSSLPDIDFDTFLRAVDATRDSANPSVRIKEYGEDEAVVRAETQAKVAGFVQAFRLFDPEATGRMPELELRHLMTRIGDAMSEEEYAESMLRNGHGLVEDGMVQYEEFIRRMMWH